jgi:hypothetical protein
VDLFKSAFYCEDDHLMTETFDGCKSIYSVTCRFLFDDAVSNEIELRDSMINECGTVGGIRGGLISFWLYKENKLRD